MYVIYVHSYVHTHAYLPLSTEEIALSARISLELPALILVSRNIIRTSIRMYIARYCITQKINGGKLDYDGLQFVEVYHYKFS